MSAPKKSRLAYVRRVGHNAHGSFCRKALADYMALPPGMTLLDLVNRDLLRMELLGVLRDRMLRLRG